MKNSLKIKMSLLILAAITFIAGVFVAFWGVEKNKTKNKEDRAYAANYWLMKPNTKYTIDSSYDANSDIADEIFNNYTISASLSCTTIYDTDGDASWMHGNLYYYDTSGNVCIIFPVTKIQYYTDSDHDYYGWYEVEDITNNGTPTVKNQYGLKLYNAFREYGEGDGKVVLPIHWNGTSNDDLNNSCSRSVEADQDPIKDGTFKSTINLSYSSIYFWAESRYENNLLRVTKFMHGQNGSTIFTSNDSTFNIDSKLKLCLFVYIFNEGKIRSNPTVNLNKDLSDVNITPIGNASRPFQGTFNGNGHTISGLALCSTRTEKKEYGTTYYNYFFGMFAYVKDATIKNLFINNTAWTATADSTRGCHAGILVGFAEGSVNIESCMVRGSSLNITYSRGETPGDFNDNYEGGVGGLVGETAASSTITIKNCAVEVNITSRGSSYVGCLLGGLGESSTANIRSNYFKGNVTATGWHMYFGGLVGGEKGTTNASQNYIGLLGGELKDSYYYFKGSHGVSGDWDCGEYAYSGLAKGLSENNNNQIYVSSSVKFQYYYNNGTLTVSFVIADTNITAQANKLSSPLF